ncbi:MAG: PHB depolymerase family esterase [Phycisphaerales bacterium]
MLTWVLAAVCVVGQPEVKPVAEPAAAAPEQRAEPQRRRMEWTIDGLKREAIVIAPAGAKARETGPAAPVIFGFHGHGGTARYAERRFAYHEHWPEAICVYMQGVPTPGRLTDPEGKKNGWQNLPGLHGDRDLKFFDAVLETMRKEYRVDDDRVYAAGHSNGGGFTYLLWAERGDVFAAFAPAAAGAAGARAGLSVGGKLKPKPVMHIAGREDALVKFEWQQLTMNAVRRVNGCADAGTEWARDCTLYASKTGTPVVTMITGGGHEYPKEAPALTVRFFKEQRRPTASAEPKRAPKPPE